MVTAAVYLKNVFFPFMHLWRRNFFSMMDFMRGRTSVFLKGNSIFSSVGWVEARNPTVCAILSNMKERHERFEG